MLFWFLFVLMFLPMTILYPTKVIHKERMTKNKKCIATSNHYTNVDGLIYNCKFARKFIFMTKKELFKNKFLAFIFKRIGMFPVDRTQVSPAVFKRVLSELKANHQVFIFPEGTRNQEGTEEMNSVKQGIITFASKGDAEIVPMVMYRKPKVFRKNYIIIGEPFKVVGENPARLTKDEIQENLKIYTQKMNDLRVEVDEIATKKKRSKNAK